MRWGLFLSLILLGGAFNIIDASNVEEHSALWNAIENTSIYIDN
jgi:hypothetical protein